MNDEELEKRARADLRRMVSGTSPRLRERLDEIARDAAREAPRPAPFRGWRLAFPVGGGVLAAVLAVVMLKPPQPPQPAAPVASGAQGDDLVLLLNVDNLDLLEQMEFYQWLDREPGLLDAGAPAPADPQRS
jgi:hypothetical protein